jgi:hypothetical protein
MLLIRTDSLGFSGCHDQRVHPIIGVANLSTQVLTLTEGSGLSMTTISLPSTLWNIPADDACLYYTGVPKTPTDGIEIYPIPATNELHIKGITSANYELFNLQGQLVVKGSITGDTMITTAPLASGSYVLHITADTKNILKKIMIVSGDH